MVIDTSAIVAILFLEEDAAELARRIERSTYRIASAVSILEAGILMQSRVGDDGVKALDAFLARARIEVVSFDARQSDQARDAFRRFGKGRHPARLNLGDCATYALSRTTGEPLLFKGNDFALTDVVRCP